MKKLLLLFFVLGMGIQSAFAVFTATRTNVTAFGCNDGKITLSRFSSTCNNYSVEILQNGNPYLTDYLSGTNILTGFAPGVYTVNMAAFNTAGNPCPTPTQGTATFTLTITEPACVLTLDINSSTNVTEFGCNDGEITVTANTASCLNTISYNLLKDGNPYATASNTEGQSVQWTNLPEGNYVVEASNGTCQASETITITQPTCDINVTVINTVNTAGVNCATGSIEFSSSSATGCLNGGNHNVDIYKDGSLYTSSTYNFGSPQTYSNLAAGTYELVVTNLSCADTATVEIEDPACDISINLDQVDNSGGYNCNNGAIYFTANTNTCNPTTYVATLKKNGSFYSMIANYYPYYYYYWGSQYSFGSIGPGAYELTLFDGECQKILPITITEPPCNLNVKIDTTDNLTGFACNNGAIYYNVTDSFSCATTYYWQLFRDGALYNQNYYYNQATLNSGQQSYIGLPPGNYYYVVNNGYCTDTSATVTITEPACENTITIDGTTNITGLACNDGTITFTPITASLCTPNYISQLYKDGSLYTYLNGNNWTAFNSGQQSYTGLPSGNYFVVINNGYCEDTSATVTITEPTCDVAIAIDATDSISEWGCPSGSILFTPSTNVSNCNQSYLAYLYQNGNQVNSMGWNNFNAGQQVFENLNPENYYIVVTNGVCTDTSAIIHIQEPQTNPVVVQLNAVNNVNSNGCNNGSVQFTYFSNSTCAPYYSFILSDATTGNWIQSQYGNWQPIGNGQQGFYNLAPGTYYVWCNNQYQWYPSTLITITEPPILPCDLDIALGALDTISEWGCPSGSIEFTPTATVRNCQETFETFLLYNGNQIVNSLAWQSYNNGPQSFNSLNPGDYNIIVYNGICYDTSAIIQIQEPNTYPEEIVIDLVTNSSGYNCNNGSVLYTPVTNSSCATQFHTTLYKSGVAVQSIGWTAYGSGQLIYNNLDSGTYTIGLYNGYISYESLPFTISFALLPPPQFTLDSVNNSTGYLCNNGSIYFTPTQTNPCKPYYRWELYKDGNFYNWSWGFAYGTQSSATGLPFGNYELKIFAHQDYPYWTANYLDTTVTFTITEPAKPAAQLTLDAVNNSTGYLCNNGNVVFTPTQTNACAPSYLWELNKNGVYYQNSYYWANFGSQNSIGGLAPGNYELIIKPNGTYNDTSLTFTITEPTSCDANAVIDNVTFGGGCNSGVIYYTINNTSCPNSFNITLYKNGNLFTTTNVSSNSQYQFTNLSAGTYYIVASNGNCSDTTNTVVVNNQITISSSLPNPICDVLLPIFTVTPSNAVASPSYRWKINGVTMQTSASTTYSPVSISNGDVVTCQLLGTGCNITSNSLTLQEVVCTDANITVKAYLQGYYQSNSEMTPTLMNEGVGNSSTIVDTVTIEFHENTSPYAVAYTHTGVIDINGNISFTLPSSSIGNNFYISIKHRNSIETWSANPVPIAIATAYDFTLSANKAYGDNMILTYGAWTIFSGDINQDGIIDNGDYTPWETDANDFAAGYLSTDLNGDGAVDNGDYIFWESNSNNFAGTAKP